MKRELNPKQKRFAELYCINLNASDAAQAAGYSKDTAYSIGHRLLKNVEVQKYISEIQSDLEKASGITKLKVINALAEVAFSNMSRYHNTWIEKKDFESIPESDKAAIQEIQTKITRRNSGTDEDPLFVDVEFVKLRLYDRLQALSKLTDIMGFNKPNTLNVAFDQLSDQQLNEIIANITKNL